MKAAAAARRRARCFVGACRQRLLSTCCMLCAVAAVQVAVHVARCALVVGACGARGGDGPPARTREGERLAACANDASEESRFNTLSRVPWARVRARLSACVHAPRGEGAVRREPIGLGVCECVLARGVSMRHSRSTFGLAPELLQLGSEPSLALRTLLDLDQQSDVCCLHSEPAWGEPGPT